MRAAGSPSPGAAKFLDIGKIHKIHVPKVKVCVFFEKRSACGRIIDHGVLGGTLKLMQIDKIHNIHVPKFQGRVFFEKNKNAPVAGS